MASEDECPTPKHQHEGVEDVLGELRLLRADLDQVRTERNAAEDLAEKLQAELEAERLKSMANLWGSTGRKIKASTAEDAAKATDILKGDEDGTLLAPIHADHTYFKENLAIGTLIEDVLHPLRVLGEILIRNKVVALEEIGKDEGEILADNIVVGHAEYFQGTLVDLFDRAAEVWRQNRCLRPVADNLLVPGGLLPKLARVGQAGAKIVAAVLGDLDAFV